MTVGSIRATRRQKRSKGDVRLKEKEIEEKMERAKAITRVTVQEKENGSRKREFEV